jgi:hypothetical protein
MANRSIHVPSFTLIAIMAETKQAVKFASARTLKPLLQVLLHLCSMNPLNALFLTWNSLRGAFYPLCHLHRPGSVERTSESCEFIQY